MIKELGNHKARLIVNIGSGSNRKRVTKTVTYSGKRDLRKQYEEFEAEVKRSPLLDITVGELMQRKIERAEALNLKATTLRGYRTCEKRFNSRFKTISACKLTAYQIDQEILSMGQYGLSAKTIRNTIGFLSSAYEYAMRVGQIDANPCKKCSLPQGQSREVRILYREEIQGFLFALAEVMLDEKVAYELALFLGLRRSEILGLKEGDVDIVQGLISIHATRHRVNGEDVIQTTKTKRSTRVLALPDILVLDIARLIETHKHFPYEKTDYLIQNGFGEPLGSQALSSRLARLEEKHGLPHVTLHGLRHTYATLLHSEGVDMAQISAELGHSNLTTTMNIYTHLFNSASASSRGIANVVNQFEKNLPQSRHTE